MYGHHNADWRADGDRCSLTQGWDIGYYEVALSSEYDTSMGIIWKVVITNSLDEGLDNESIGF
jgi:hypothetical protein